MKGRLTLLLSCRSHCRHENGSRRHRLHPGAVPGAGARGLFPRVSAPSPHRSDDGTFVNWPVGTLSVAPEPLRQIGQHLPPRPAICCGRARLPATALIATFPSNAR